MTSQSDETSELALIRTILGEDTPTDILLKYLEQAHFDVSAAINLYFANVTIEADTEKCVRSGMVVTLHEYGQAGMLAKSDVYATFTRGAEVYDTITPSNQKFRVMRFRKRGGSVGPYLRNGDIVSIECHGLWLKGSKVAKYLQWKSPCEDDRSKFVIRGLSGMQWLTIETPFFLTSYKWSSREFATRQDKPVNLLTYNSHIHRCLIGLDKPKRHGKRLYLQAKFTEVSRKRVSLSSRMRAVCTEHQNALQMQSIANAISQNLSPLMQMKSIVGEDVPEKTIVQFLDGAGGNVEIAIEHYFMTKTSEASAEVGRPASWLLIPMPSADPVEELCNEESVTTPSTPDHANNIVERMPSRDGSSIHAESTISTSVNESGIADVKKITSSTLFSAPESSSLNIGDFEMISVLGRGSFGAVMMVRYKADGRIFAIKILKKTNMDSQDIANAMEERQILQRINHPYVSSLVFAFQTNERLYMGMKYYAAGDLFYHLNQRGRLSTADARLYAAELVLAISYLHDLNILYRDLKPSNVMLDTDGHIGVVDFGLSKQHISSGSHGVKTLSGTAEYVAPEALVQYADGTRDYGKAYDWWSLGVVLYEMLVGQSPFYDDNELKMLENIINKQVKYPSFMTPEAKDLLENGLLIRDPSLRLGAQREGVRAIKAHPFFEPIDWEKLERREVEPSWKPKLTSETDTRYVDPEFIEEGPPSAVYDPSANVKKSKSKRFSQFSFDFRVKR